jgi:hypothetical protein
MRGVFDFIFDPLIAPRVLCALSTHRLAQPAGRRRLARSLLLLAERDDLIAGHLDSL